MSGMGVAYAGAAWDNGVYLRWAPALYIENKGVVAIALIMRGYGGYSFGSWEEGINRVVSALGGSLYGGYLTREAAAHILSLESRSLVQQLRRPNGHDLVGRWSGTDAPRGLTP